MPFGALETELPTTANMRAAELPRLADEYQEAHPARGSVPIPA